MPSYPDNITIKRLERTSIGSGNFSSIYSDLSTIKARVQPISDKENLRSGRKRSEKSFNVYIKVSEDVNMKDKIVFEGTTYNIVELEKYPNIYIKLIITLE